MKVGSCPQEQSLVQSFTNVRIQKNFLCGFYLLILTILEMKTEKCLENQSKKRQKRWISLGK